MHAGIMVVAAQREIRRAVFDALDHEGHLAVHSARDTTHAGILLEGRSPLSLVVMVLDGDARDALASVEQLRRLPACADAPLIAVLSADASLKPVQLPAGVSDWLYASQIQSELIARWHRLQRMSPPTREASVATATKEAGDYRFAFDEMESEWLIVDAARGRILEWSPALVRRSGLPGDRLLGQPVTELLSFQQTPIEQVMTDGSRHWHACRRRSLQGFDSGEASVRQVRHGGTTL